MRTKIRPRSGVYPIPIYTMPWQCGGDCIYCPSVEGIPKSYVANSDTLFARRVQFDPAKQLARYVIPLSMQSNKSDKIEVIVLGGNFSSLPKDYRTVFVKAIYDTLNGKHSENIEEAIEYQRSSSLRCVALDVESRPDFIDSTECRFLLGLGVTKVELGVQSLDENVLDRINRGHRVRDVKLATKLLKNHGLKVGFHIMLGLPGSSVEGDLWGARQVFLNPSLCPDFLKIYPCVLLHESDCQPLLWQAYQDGSWVPHDTETLRKVVSEIKSITPRFVRISRIQRQFPANQIAAGPAVPFRKDMHVKCSCIRCREIGFHKDACDMAASNLEWRLRHFSQGKGVFLEACLKQQEYILLGIARLSKGVDGFAYLRELKVFGKAASIGRKGLVQHRGVGHDLLKHAEKLAKELLHCDTLRVHAGVGVRTYYENAGYSSSAGYMAKELTSENQLKAADLRIFAETRNGLLNPDLKHQSKARTKGVQIRP